MMILAKLQKQCDAMQQQIADFARRLATQSLRLSGRLATQSLSGQDDIDQGSSASFESLFTEDTGAEESDRIVYGEPRYDKYTDDYELCVDSGEGECSNDEQDEEEKADHDEIDGKVESKEESEGLNDANIGNGDGAVPPRPEQFLLNGVLAAIDKLSWLSKGTEVMVDQRSLVVFSIGRRNTHAFVMKGKRIVLTPRRAQTSAINIQHQHFSWRVWEPGAAAWTRGRVLSNPRSLMQEQLRDKDQELGDNEGA